MQVIRTLVWVVITALLVTFIAMNWDKAPVRLWPLSDGNYVYFQWPVGVIALIFFLLGLIPAWLMLRATRWRLKRRIAALENSVRATAAAAPVPGDEPAEQPDAPFETAPSDTTIEKTES